MRTLTATSASRGFSELLDVVERGETVRITRGGHPVAELRPVPVTTGRALREALAGAPRLDDRIVADIAAATSMLTEADDPWRAA